MTIRFLYGRRESLIGKSEAYKKGIRGYLESFGFSQTTDSVTEGTFEDMVFYNPTMAPKQRFLIEAKAENLSLKSKNLAKELVKYFRMWQATESAKQFKFLLFIQGVKKAKEWEMMFSNTDNLSMVVRWCRWYNTKCTEPGESLLKGQDRLDIARFFAESEVTVGNRVQLELAASEKEVQSASSIARTSKRLLNIVNKRREPIMEKSMLIMNVLPISVPGCYYVCPSKASDKQEIYDTLKDEIIPPFIWRRDKSMMSFVQFDRKNPLFRYKRGNVETKNTEELQTQNPALGSGLVNIHLRRIIWNRGVYRDGRLFYFPMLDKSKEKRLELNRNGRKRWVTKKLVHKKDTPYAKRGDINFFFHRAIELGTPTYWGTSYIELTPRKYYTLDGKTPIEGDIRAKMDAKFRNPLYDRGRIRVSLMKFWKYILLESRNFVIPSEEWFDLFDFGDFLRERVDWSPKVIGRDQTRLWDFGGLS